MRIEIEIERDKERKKRAIEYVTVYYNAKIDMSRKLSIYWLKWKLPFKSQNTLRAKPLQSNGRNPVYKTWTFSANLELGLSKLLLDFPARDGIYVCY